MRTQVSGSSRYVAWLVAAVAIVVVAAGCGSSRPTPKTADRTTNATTSSSAASLATASPALSPERYRAITAISRAGLPLDSGNDPAWRRAERSVCQRIDQLDPLLRAFRSQCLAAADTYFADAAGRACPAKYASASNPLVADNRIARCQARSYATWATASSRYLDATETLDRAVGRYVRNGLAGMLCGVLPAS